MKNLILTIILVFVGGTLLQAQMNSGSKFVAGYNQLSFNSNSYKEKGSSLEPDKYTNFDLTTKAGYFMKNRIAIGGMVNYNLSRTNYKVSMSKYTNTSWLIGPLARYYTEYGSLIPFAEASVGFGMNVSKQESDLYNSETKHSVFGLKGGVGANYFLNESIAFEGMLYYYYNTLKPKSAGAIGPGHIESGLGVNFGIIFYFGTI